MQKLHFKENDNIEDIKKCFDTNGAVIIKNLLPKNIIEDFKTMIIDLLKTKMNQLSIDYSNCKNIDEYYDTLLANSEFEPIKLIVAIKESINFYTLACNEKINHLVKQLINAQHLHINHDISQFRIDSPDNNRFFRWHQEYPYNLCSLSTITLWAPLTSITEELGRLKVILGSHKEVLPVDFYEKNVSSRKGKGNTVYALNNLTEEELDEKSIEVDDLQPTDMLFIHSCVLHRSGRNLSNRSRWVFNSRVGDLADKELINRNWECVRDNNKYLFNKLYPHLVHIKS